MKLSEYMKHLRKLIKDNPEAKDYVVVCSSDDEGNSFQEVLFHPTIGIYVEEGRDGSFYAGSEDMDLFMEEFHPDVDPKPNAICVN